MREDRYNTNSTDISTFNEASYQIARLHELWKTCRKHNISGNLDAWNWELNNAWLELSSDATKLDGNITKKNQYFIKKALIDMLIIKLIKNKNTESLYNILMYKEQFIRKLQDDCGKGGKYEDSSTSGMTL